MTRSTGSADRRSRGRRVPALLGVALVALVIVLMLATRIASGATAPTLRYVFGGHAYGSYARTGATAQAGRSAVIELGCRTRAPAHLANTVATVSRSPFVTS